MGCFASIVCIRNLSYCSKAPYSPMQGFAKQRGIRVSILTGDVHLACYGQVRRLKGDRLSGSVPIHQIRPIPDG